MTRASESKRVKSPGKGNGKLLYKSNPFFLSLPDSSLFFLFCFDFFFLFFSFLSFAPTRNRTQIPTIFSWQTLSFYLHLFHGAKRLPTIDSRDMLKQSNNVPVGKQTPIYFCQILYAKDEGVFTKVY